MGRRRGPALSKVVTRPPSYSSSKPSSRFASKVGKANSPKRSKLELVLRSAIHRLGGRYSLRCDDLPGKPDLAFRAAKVAVFCDGDFWHGRDWKKRKALLANGANGRYWVAKIKTNILRDRNVDRALRGLGWLSIRFWERDIRYCPTKAAKHVIATVANRRTAKASNQRRRSRPKPSAFAA